MAKPPLQYRTVFISDVHLGSVACKIEEFNEFLASFHAESIYLVGDIVDVWMVVKKGKWRPEHTTAVKRLLDKSEQGCTIHYLPGNHDTFARSIGSLEMGNIRIADTFVHETADNRKLLVIHGDQFDASVRSFAVAFTSAWVYEVITMYRLATRKSKSSSGKLKRSFKKLISIMGKYEEKLVLAAQTEDCDGVICGHIHRPDLTLIDEVIYGNTGDWVESCTCIVEHLDGRLELMTWDKMKAQMAEIGGSGSNKPPEPPINEPRELRAESLIKQLAHKARTSSGSSLGPIGARRVR